MEGLGASLVQDGNTLRVEGVLAVTRAFGNIPMKNHIQAEPEVSKHEVTLADDFVIIASDGLWDELNEQSAVRITPTLVLYPCPCLACRCLLSPLSCPCICPACRCLLSPFSYR